MRRFLEGELSLEKNRASHPLPREEPARDALGGSPFVVGDGGDAGDTQLRFLISCGSRGVANSAVNDVRGRVVPVLVLVASEDERDAIVRELLARNQEVLVSQTRGADGGVIKVGELRIDKNAHRVTVGDDDISLTVLEFKLLVTMAERREIVQPRGELLRDVWNVREGNATRTVDTHVKRLRDKLRTAARFLQCVRGVGYLFSEVPSAGRSVRHSHKEEPRARLAVSGIPLSSLPSSQGTAQ